MLGLSLAAALPVGDVPISGEAAQQGDLVKSLIFSGELQAVEATLINTPNIGRLWIYPISYLAPEGRPVQAGDVLVRFDRTALDYRRLETEKVREDARLSVARKQTELAIRRQDTLLQLAEAEKKLRVAEIYGALDKDLISRADAERYAYELSTAQVEVEKARGQLANQAAAGQAELEVEYLKLRKADLELSQMVLDLKKMTIYSQGPGIPLYALGNANRKIQVGDNVFKGSPVLRIPHMDQLKVVASVFDAEFPHLQVGQAATIVLDAVPDRSFPGQIIRIPEAATPPKLRFSRSPARMFQVEFLLLEKDLSFMKPGMSARVEVPFNAGSGLLVPRSKIFYEDGETFVRARGSNHAVPVKILNSNHKHALVEANLAPGTPLEDRPQPSVSGDRALEWHTVRKEDLRFTVSGSGVLEAARSADITPPVVPNVWNFKIKYLVPEGQAVRSGQVVAELDAPEVHKTLLEEEASLEKVQQQLARTEASLHLKLSGLELELEEAQAAFEKASSKLQEARLFQSSLEIKQAEFEAEFARQKVAILEEKLELTRQGIALELELLRDREQLHEQLAASAREVLSLLKLRAPRDGIAIYAKSWNFEKKRVGGDVNLYEKILFLPDLKSLRVAGQISEVDAGKIGLGQEVEVSIDALPDRTFGGRIEEISQIFTLASHDRPVKVVNIQVQLNRLDPKTMRPGMVARLRVAIDDFESVLAIPLTMVLIEGHQAYVCVNRSGKPVKTPIEIGRSNGVVGIVERGLADGDEILAYPQQWKQGGGNQP